jgi:hypothetical protein
MGNLSHPDRLRDHPEGRICGVPCCRQLSCGDVFQLAYRQSFNARRSVHLGASLEVNAIIPDANGRVDADRGTDAHGRNKLGEKNARGARNCEACGDRPKSVQTRDEPRPDMRAGQFVGQFSKSTLSCHCFALILKTWILPRQTKLHRSDGTGSLVGYRPGKNDSWDKPVDRLNEERNCKKSGSPR